MKKLLALMLVLIMSLAVVGCSNKDLAQETGEVVKQEEPKKEEPKKEEAVVEVVDEMAELALSDSLKLNIATGNNSRTITYQQATPITLPDGTVVAQGDLKPTWQEFQKLIGVELVDVTVQDQKPGEMIDLAAATGFSDATVYGGNSIAEKFMSYGAQGYFINIKDYLGQMPNLAGYLIANPNVAKSITAYDGGIYHIPYVAEVGNYARTFNARKSWIEALLDSDAALEPETAKIKTAYVSNVDRQATNVVDLQNAAAGSGLTRDVARDTLLAYISETYPGLAKPSDLYLGTEAQYDVDELVALLRLVELSPNTLSKLETGAVVSGVEISPLFVRESKYREDLLRLALYFNGQRVYGSDSYDARFYTDEKGELHYSYAEEDFLTGVDNLKALYEEGLIHSEFADLSNKDNFRTIFFAKDDEEAHIQFGFMTIDWIASTTATNDDVVSVLPPLVKMKGAEDQGYIHFIENTRVIKPDGWAISTASTEEEINSATQLFDVLFTPEGYIAQNYGPPSVLEVGQTYTSGGIDYPKFNQWVLDAAGEFMNGNIANFLRDYLGSHIPIGYAKEIGFEKQYTLPNGIAAWDTYETAKVLQPTYEEQNTLFRLVPPVISLNEQDTAKLNTLAVGDEQIDSIFLYITGSENAVGSVSDIAQLYADAGMVDYMKVYTNAYLRMIAE